MYPWLDYILKPIGWVLGMLSIVFMIVFLGAGSILGVIYYLIADGFRMGMMKMEIWMNKPDMESPWSKLPGATSAPAKSRNMSTSR